MREKPMVCAYCNKAKAWPDAFVSRLSAECWECWVRRHMEEEHRPSWLARWRARRAA